MGKQYGSRLAILTGLALMLAAVLAAAPPLVLNHQGRLLDATDAPVADGTYTLIFSLFASPDGGPPLWSETRDVVAKSGLISCDLGRVVPLDGTVLGNDSLFLQVQVAGEAAMTPRLRVGSVPMAGVSGGVHGDIVTSPGSLVVSNALGTNEVHVVATDNAVGIAIDEPGVHIMQKITPDSIVYDQGGDAGSRVMIHKIHMGGEIRSMQAVYPDSTVFDQGGDFGTASVIHRDLAARNFLLTERAFSTGFDSAGVSEACDATGARLAIKTKGTSAKREIKASTGLDASTLAIDDDSDGDGVEDGIIGLSSGNGESQVSVARKRPGKVKYSNITLRTTEDMVTKDEDCDGDGDDVYDSRLSSTLGGGGAGGSVMLAADLDGDGVMDNAITDSVDAAGVRRRYGSSGNLGSSGQDGVSIAASATSGASVRCDSDSDGDGVPDNEASLHVAPTTSGVAIKTKGTGADANRVVSVSSGTDVSAASLACDIDDDGDGVPESEISSVCLPVSSRVAIKTKGTGADPNRVSITQTTDTTRASSVMAVDLDGDGLADRSVTMDCDDTDGGITVEGASSSVKIKHKGWDGLIYGRMAIETGGAIEVDFGGNGVGFVSQRFGVGVLSPTHPFEHSSGAHLTAGGVWTNASDKNLKENFQPVDGGEILGKIEQLPISRWNYKNESCEITHIGPTAQDFKKIFGVGDNDKSISTIDPAGIALAAIKELHKEILGLKDELAAKAAETDDLRAQVTRLSTMVEIIMGAKNADETTARLVSSK